MVVATRGRSSHTSGSQLQQGESKGNLLDPVLISVDTRPFQSIIIGPRGRTIQNITAEAQVDLELALQCPVELKLFVRVDKNLKR